MTTETNGDIIMMDIQNAAQTPIQIQFILEDIGKQENRLNRLFTLQDEYSKKVDASESAEDRIAAQDFLDQIEEDIEEVTERIQNLNRELDYNHYD